MFADIGTNPTAFRYAAAGRGRASSFRRWHARPWHFSRSLGHPGVEDSGARGSHPLDPLNQRERRRRRPSLPTRRDEHRTIRAVDDRRSDTRIEPALEPRARSRTNDDRVGPVSARLVDDRADEIELVRHDRRY